MIDPLLPNSPGWRAAEIPSANGFATATGLARLYGALAHGGVLRPLPARLAREVLKAHGRELAAAGPHHPVTLRFSQEEMSQMLGASRQSINRLLKQWERGGAIEVAYRSLTVLDPEALRLLTERDEG